MGKRGRGASIESTLGNIQSEEDRIADMQKKLAELEERRQAEEAPLPPEERADLKELIFLGSMHETVDFDGFKFQIRTLSNTEAGDIISDLALYDIKDRGMALRTLSLARAIVSVNGAPIESLYRGNDPELSVIEKRVEVIDSWQNTLVSALFEAYEKVLVKSKNVFSSELMGDKIKN